MDRAPAEPAGLSSQQSRPLKVEGASVALSAGAGCGKTTVLTSRYLGDLEGDSRRPLRSIVALTFTEKAARELRQRIRARCREKLESGEDAGRWRAVLRGLEAAPIGTFHEFCGQWLRRHAVAAGIDPDFGILDESIAGSIRDEALARCLRRCLADCDPDLIELAVEFGLARVRESLTDLLGRRSLGDIETWASKTPDELIGLWRDAWSSEGRPARLLGVLQAARSCVESLIPHEPTHPTMRARRAFLLEHLADLEPFNPPDDWLSEVREQAKVQGGGTKIHWSTPDIYEEVRDGLARLRGEIKEFQERARWDEDATREAAEHGLRFARLAAKARREYDAAKRARGGLDFDDMILKTRDLLRDRPEGEGLPPEEIIARLLVDEFQDTDPVQGEILEKLGGAEFALGRLFLVGDSKQSIYRFRGAQPRIFQDFRARFPAQGRHALTENFRSVPGILDFVNALFAATYPGDDVRLVPGATTLTPDDAPAVEFLWAVETDEEAGPQGAAHDRRITEARWLARRLRQRLDAGWIVRDRETKSFRGAEPKDIALLFRAMTDVAPYEAALDDEGLDYHTLGGSAFYAQQEVHDLINLLSVVEDPRDAVSLAGALRGPFFGLSDEGLFWLAAGRSGDLAEGLERVEDVAELSPIDRARAERVRDALDRWRTLKDRVPIAALVDRALDESGFEPAQMGEFLGARKRANVRKLVRLAREFDRQGGFTLAAFVARLRADLRRPPREEQAATTVEEGTSIRLMSIHQAKGLEFPIVVLPDLNRKSPGVRDSVAFHPVLGPLVRPFKERTDEDPSALDRDNPAPSGDRQSLGWLAFQAIERREADAESLRLFYVALTPRRLDPLGRLRCDGAARIARHDPARTAIRPPHRDLPNRAPGRVEPAPGPGHARMPSVPGRALAARRVASPLDEIAEAIDATPVRPDLHAPPAPRLPRFVDLDPARGLSPRSARLDRLVRSILIDPRAFAPGQLPAIAARAARTQDPAAPESLVDEALDRLRPWIEGPFGRELARSAAIERGLAWTVVWPPDAVEATVFQGSFDLIAQDRSGGWRLVLVGDASAPPHLERLRLALATHAAAALGFGPIVQAWQIRLGPGGGLQGDEPLDSAGINAAWRAALESGF